MYPAWVAPAFAKVFGRNAAKPELLVLVLSGSADSMARW